MDMKLLNDAGLNVDDHVLKLVTAAAGAVGDVLVTWGMPSDKSNALVVAITLITMLLIAGISHVQASKLKAQGEIGAAANTTPAPQNQTNVGSKVDNAAPANPIVQPETAQPFTPAQLDAIYAEVARRAAAHARARAIPPIDAPKGS